MSDGAKNETQRIVEALRAVGCCVAAVASLCGGLPDLLVKYSDDDLVRLRVLDASVASERGLTSSEEVFAREWNVAVCVVESVEEALAAVGGG